MTAEVLDWKDDNSAWSTALEELDSAYQALLVASTPARVKRFGTCLRRTTREAGNSNVPEVLLKLAQHHLHYFEQHVKNPTRVIYTMTMLDGCLHYIVKADVLEFLSETPRYKHLIACLCMMRAEYTNMEYSKKANTNVRTILTRWKNAPVDNETMLSLRPMVDFLYGKVVWDLYCNDTPLGKSLPLHLLSMALPLLGLKKPQIAAQPTVVAPYNF